MNMTGMSTWCMHEKPTADVVCVQSKTVWEEPVKQHSRPTPCAVYRNASFRLCDWVHNHDVPSTFFSKLL